VQSCGPCETFSEDKLLADQKNRAKNFDTPYPWIRKIKN